jgi:hypothetical protein
MMSNGHLREQWVEAHRQDLQREAELRRRARHLRQSSVGQIRRSVGRLGAFFVMLGTRLQGLEWGKEHATHQL